MPSALGPAALGLWAYISGKSLVPMLQLSNIYMYVIVIPQYEYNILVITQVRGEAEDVGNN